MLDDRTSPSDIKAEMAEPQAKLHPLRPGQKTLGQSMGTAVDQINQIPTDLGLRPYRVFLVHWEWPERKGVGIPKEISRREILPTPKVNDISGTTLALASTGLTEMGGISITGISQRYSEADLTGRTPDLRDPVRDRTSKSTVEFFYEVVADRKTIPRPAPRRFAPSTVPMLYRTGMYWRIVLTKQASTYTGDAEVIR